MICKLEKAEFLICFEAWAKLAISDCAIGNTCTS